MKISSLILGLLGVSLILFIGYAIAALPPEITITCVIGFFCFVITMFNVKIGLYLLVFVVPFTQQLTISTFGASPIDIGTDDVLILFIVLSWLANLARKKEPVVLRTSLNWPLFVFFVACIFSFNGADARFGEGTILVGLLHLFKFFEYIVVYFIVVSTIKSLDEVRKFLYMCFAVVAFIVIVQCVTMFTWGFFSLNAPKEMTVFYMQTMHAFVSNSILGAYYAFFLSIVLAIVLDTPLSRGKVPLLIFAALISFTLFNTYSRSAYLGLIGSFLIIGRLKERRFFLIVLLFVFLSPIYMQSAVLERITITVQAVKPNIVFDESSAIRLQLWRRGLKAFGENFLLGTGYWTTRYILHATVHNQYLAILIETGVVGFSIFCWLIVRMIANAMRLIKKAQTDFIKNLGIGYIAGLVAILSTCFFSETLEAFRIIGPLWFVTGLITSASRLSVGKIENKDMDST